MKYPAYLPKKTKVLIAMSGGIDSSVAAALLKKEGCECIGVYMRFWSDSVSGGAIQAKKCCNLDALEDARWVCNKLGIPFYVMNAAHEFKKHVVDYFLDAYSCAKTPNPCVECNRNIKFGLLLARAKELGADYVATGHYAGILTNKKTGEKKLTMAFDKNKDQTYFLYSLMQKKLESLLFPIGGMSKQEVYKLARKFGLARVIKKSQSQDICFFPEKTPERFLRRNLGIRLFKAGKIAAKNGTELGVHKGLPFYTIGQRCGIGIGGMKGCKQSEPWYVIGISKKRNQLIVGHKNDLYCDSFKCGDLSFVSGRPPKSPIKISVRIRHRGILLPAILHVKKGIGFVKKTNNKKHFFRAVAPGQAAVFYIGKTVLGGGVIL